MPNEPKAPASAERKQTDESLRTERRNADRALGEMQAHVELDADNVVDLARERADAVVTAARDKADDSAPTVARALQKERALEDRVLDDERVAADEVLRREREASARALFRMLPLERDETDRYLFSERTRSDVALSNRDDFLGVVSHDLRNLLNGVTLSAEIMSRNALATTEGQPVIDGAIRIQRYVARMNRLIGDLVDIASIDAGSLSVSPVPSDAVALVAEAVDLFHVTATAKQVSLESRLADAALPAQLDHDRMLQVLANLITNAIKFCPAGGKVCVGVERRADDVRFFVIDDGPGIPSTMLDAVFDRFTQVAKNDSRGLGLGLYISKRLVEAHGGKIWAESTLGNGTTISLSVPVARA